MVTFMYNEILSAENKKLSLKENSSLKNNLNNEKKLEFREILCPKSCQAISSEECKTCSSRQELHRKHKLGLSLVTIICMWKVTKTSSE